MSNVNLGGIQSDLILETREWVQPAREALASFRALGAGIASSLDGINRNTSEMVRSIQDMNSRTRQVTNDVAQGFRQMGQAVASVATSMRAAVLDVVTTFAGFDKQMRNTDAIAKLTQGQLRDLSKAVRDMGGDLKLTQGPTTLAAGLKEIAGAGYNAADSLKILAAAAKAADAGDTTAAIMAKALTPTIKDYGLTAEHAGLVTDQLFRAIDQGNLSAEDLATQFGSVAPVAAAAGVSLQELSGAFALMSTKGQSASENATQLRSVINHLTSPAADAGKLLEQYGVQAGETAIRTRGLVGVLKELFEKTGGNKIALKRILDDEGLQAAIKLIGADAGQSFHAAIANQFGADGATQDAFNRQSEGIIFKFKQVQAAFENFKVGLAAGFEPILGPLADGLQKVATYLVKLPDSTKAAIGGFAGLAAVVTTVASGALLLSPTIIQIARFVTDLGGVSRIAATAIGTLEGAMTTIASVIADLAAPVALVVAGIATLGIAWKRDWGGIREFTSEVLTDIQAGVESVASGLADTFGPAVQRIAADFREGWPYVQQFFSDMAQAVFETAIPALKQYWEFSRDVFGGFAAVVKTAWGVVGPTIRLVAQTVKDMVSVVSVALQGDWNGAWNVAVDAVSNLGPRIKSALAQVVVNVQEGLGDLGRKIRQAFTDALNGGDSSNSIVGPELYKNLRANLAQASKNQSSVIQGAAAFAANAGLAAQPGLSSRNQIGGGLAGYTDPGDVPSIRQPKGSRKNSLTPAQMLSYIRSNAGTGGADLSGLDPETLKATYQLVHNSVVRDFKLQITSAARHGSGRSLHNSGRAVDIQALGRSNTVNDSEVPSIIRQLAAGTGFRTGLNEYRSDALAVTGGTGPHMHLTTGYERLGKGAVPGAFAVQGGGGSGNFSSVVAAIQKDQHDREEALKTLGEYRAKSLNDYQRKLIELKLGFDKAKEAAQVLGADDKTMRGLSAQYRKQVEEVQQLERRETAKTVADLTILRLEAEGQLGEAARSRIQANAAEEKAALQEKLKLYPQMAEQIAAASKAIDEGASRQLDLQGLEQGSQRFGASRDAEEFKLQDPGLTNLIAAFPQFRAEVEAAYAAVQRYIQDPSEANRQAFDTAQQFLQQQTTAVQEAQRRKLEGIEYERALGQITTDEAIARQGEILNSWVGGEESKRQALLQYSDIYREHLQQSLELQGEFNLETLQGLAEGLLQAGQLTAQQQAQLVATNQLIQQQRLQDQQNWQGILQTSTGAFQGFLGNILTGQQTFSQAFGQLWKGLATQVIQEIVKMIVKATILQKILSGIFGWFGGILGVGGGAGGLISGGGLTEFAGIGLGHSGGSVGRGWITPGPMPVFHSGGYVGGPLRSDETMAVLQTGEYVLSRQQLAGMRAGAGEAGTGQRSAPSVSITMHNTINNELDIESVSSQLGRRAAAAIQGLGS